MANDKQQPVDDLVRELARLKAENERLTRELETATKLKRQYLHAATHWHDKAERALAERAGAVRFVGNIPGSSSASGFAPLTVEPAAPQAWRGVIGGGCATKFLEPEGRQEAAPIEMGPSYDAELSICRVLDALRNGMTQEAFEQANEALLAVRATRPAEQAVTASLTATLVEQAFKDGIRYATICEVSDIDEAWRTSSVRAVLQAALSRKEEGR